MTELTPYQAKYIAYELTRRFPSGSSEKFNVTLMDAQVDLNPHQVEAALFAFKSPLSKGAILADEVGLGKTIEAGILLSQLWAERRKKLLIICPANLRKQWSQELLDKFFLESTILENKNFKDFKKSGNKNPFEQNKIVICSYQFARTKADLMQLVSWDLAVIDEAHRLRNVYKPTNKIGNAIKEALSHSRKALLTATPLQNSLLELYGLVSIIDEHTFGDIKSFRSQFLRTVDGENYQDLRDRLKSVCIRNLRRQVQEYIRYTNRIPLTIKFEPSDDEQKLYEDVSDYLQRELLYALPAGQRHLMTLILRKLLASSSFAIAGTLNSLIKKLNQVIKDNEVLNVPEEISEDYELFEEQSEEWDEEETTEDKKLNETDFESIRQEIIELEKYRDLAESIKHNTKGDKLLTALKEGFAKMDKQANQKAIIFTESTRTQNYLFNLLSEHYPNKIVLFNGSNTDETSNKVYKSWLSQNKGTDKVTGSPSADKRAALVEYFRNEATIMIATEAAAEGINLQFCSLLINYDLPWNPQRIEQRIGRCHRYGQKFDVVVVNFLNVKNAADIRVFQLLDEKFKLFSGVFGASDDVLGSIESGVDFEKRIAEIYQKYRSEKEIIDQFDLLQKELDEQISSKMLSTRETLLANFDDEVLNKLKIRLSESKEYINKYEQWLWAVTKFELNGTAKFNDKDLSFQLKKQPYPNATFPTESFKLGKPNTEAHVYRMGHPLAQTVLEKAKAKTLQPASLTFDLTGYKGNVAILDELKGQQGWLSVMAVSVDSFESSDYLMAYGFANNGINLTEDQAKRLLTLPAKNANQYSNIIVNSLVIKTGETYLDALLKTLSERDNNYLKFETEKLTKWAEDRMNAAELAIKETKAKIKELNREAQKTVDPTSQLKIQEQLQDESRKQKKQRQEIFIVEDEIAEMRDKMINDIQKRMKQEISKTHLFTINWKLV
ncbi:SNF2-related protein [Flavobacterium sp.]|uniref:SNF2-related protein n=1 Tax=Flavobacterium sp. TaxID=239 RepID=UPI003BC56464